MESFETIKLALNKANKHGVFDLNESSSIVYAITEVEKALKKDDEKSK